MGFINPLITGGHHPVDPGRKRGWKTSETTIFIGHFQGPTVNLPEGNFSPTTNTDFPSN